MAVAARAASEIMIRRSEVDFDPDRTPDNLKSEYKNLRATRTIEPDDEYGETEQLWGIREDGSADRLDWQVFYDSLQESTGENDIPRNWTEGELTLDALGRTINERRHLREVLNQSQRQNAEDEVIIATLREQLENEERLNQRLQGELDQQSEKIAQLQRDMKELRDRPVNPDQDRRRGRRLLGGIALVGASVALGYLLHKHGGPSVSDMKEILAHNQAMADQHNALVKEVNGLQNAVDGIKQQDTTIINTLDAQHAEDVSKLNHLNHHLHSLKDVLADRANGGSSGSTETATSSSGAKGRFYAEYGTGIRREISQYAQARGKNLSDSRVGQIYHLLRYNFHTKIIDIHGTPNDTYMHGNDMRLTQSGWASWFPKAGNMLAKLVNK
jgi:hypothetical protein